MSEEQLNAGKELIAYLKEKYNISKIVGHKNVDTSECPGNNFPMDELRESGSYNIEDDSNENVVKELQKALNKDNNSGLDIDGIIGPLTTRAINNNLYLIHI